MNILTVNTLCYIIITNKDCAQSFFNQYDQFLIDNVQILEKICTLPKDLSEFFYDKEHMISNRLSGVFNGYKIQLLSSCKDVWRSPYKFNVVFMQHPDQIAELPSNTIGVLSNHRGAADNDLISFGDLNTSSLLQKINAHADRLNSDDKKIFLEIKDACDFNASDKRLNLNHTFEKSIFNTASMSVLSSLRIDYDFKEASGDYDQGRVFEPRQFVSRIRAHILEKITPKVWLPFNDIVISDLSSDLNTLVRPDLYTENHLKKEGYNDADALCEAISLINHNQTNCDENRNVYLERYHQERNLIEALISVYASSYAIPCIKLPLVNGSIHDALKNVGILDRKNNQQDVNEVVLSLTDELSRNTLPLLKTIQNAYTSSVKIISNLPIEWANQNGLPLMVRHEVSRIPVSPGVAATHALLDNEQIFLNIDCVAKIKIISSFKDDDEIKDHLKNKVALFLDSIADTGKLDEHLKFHNVSPDVPPYDPLDMKIEWCNVATSEDLLEQLKSNDCAITIFDLHGGHSENGSGVLQLRDELVSIYDLVGKFNASPIVILSSCDTSPIDRNHNSTAAAFLLCGAKTVLASALPIFSDEASTFIARLLLRIKLYLPKRLDNNSGISVRWSSFVSGMIKRTFYSEFFDLLKNKFNLDAKVKSRLNFYSGNRLDPLSENWHEEIIHYTSTVTGLTPARIKQIMREEFALPECLKYIQIGNPESIILVSENHIPLAKRKV
ncbi:CHAT domain-containing protein [Pseudomonas viridiflava]|uniref:CHAT domain-containing protein n=1 Tax=Pseudomonas viridiflava TaxID=33069 RepID=UPI002EC27303|nr:CHAT domain-containing protein [Pseudomonas viridiflava]